MAKDPAFLFYPADFMIGTALFTKSQRSDYISLLCYQHQLGHLSEQEIIDICGGRDEKIFAKFIKDSEGKYYNTRLEEEKEKRQSFCQSRRINASAKHTQEHTHKRMENENEDVIKDKDTKKTTVFKAPTLEEVKAYCVERKNGINAQEFIDHYSANGWVRGKTKIKDWRACVRTWEHNKKGPKAGSEAATVAQSDSWESRAIKTCTICRGKGGVYSAEKGQNIKCSCVRPQ